MEVITTRNVIDLVAPERAAIEHLLGQPLAADQQVVIMAFTPGVTRNASARAAARIRLIDTLATQVKRATQQGVTADEADAAVEAAMRIVRPRSE